MRQRHWPNLRELPGVALSCVSNSSVQSAKKFLVDISVSAEVVDKWENVIDRSDVDVVWIAAPPFLHKDAVIKSLRAGKAVFCQARMAKDLSEAEEMCAARVQYPDVVAAFCPAPYGMSVANYVKKILSEDVLGHLIHLEFEALSDVYSDPAAPAHWRQRHEINGINFLSCGIFAEVIMDWLGEPLRISAVGQTIYKQRGPDKISLPDYALVTAVWPEGFIGHLTWSGVHFGTHRPSLKIQGTKACMMVLFEPDEIFLTTDRNSSPQKVHIPKECLSSWQVEKNFIDAVRGVAVKPGISFEEGLRYMRFTQAVVDSIQKNGVWIHLRQQQ